ncbi:MAG TPA: FIST N-terminal domain-containing protein [Acidimicrobiales bacterium]|nr:FIST N-terminal domain-containing protein [Acidimicrobiales bacterium]
MPFAAAISEHPVTAHAVGEVIGQVIEGMPGPVDLACLFVTSPHGGALEDAAAAVRAVIDPAVLMGAAAGAVAGRRREVEASAAVSLWVGAGFPAQGVQIPAGGLPPPRWDLPGPPEALVLVGDPHSLDPTELLAGIDSRFPSLPVIGGLASAAVGPGGNRLALDGRVTSSGAVGVFLGPGSGFRPLVSQGCRPVGRPWVVTRSEGGVIYELAGRPALTRLMEMVQDYLDPGEIGTINAGGLCLGVVTDELRDEYGPGDFLLMDVVGADRNIGAVAVDGEIEVGRTVQYHLRDAAAADSDLRYLAGGSAASAALLFTCNGRGTRLFGAPDHDAEVLADSLGEVPLAGMSAAGEIGPLAGRNRLLRMSASVALFDDGSRG